MLRAWKSSVFCFGFCRNGRRIRREGPNHGSQLASAQATSANGWEPHAESNAGRPGAAPRGTLSVFVRFSQNGGLTVPAHEGSGRMSCEARLTGLRGTRIDQRRPTRNLGQFTHDLPRTVDSHRFVIRQFVVPADLDLSCQHDREPVGNLTGPRQNLAGAKRAQPAKTAHPLDVGGFEDRKYLNAPWLDDRFWGHRPDLLSSRQAVV